MTGYYDYNDLHHPEEVPGTLISSQSSPGPLPSTVSAESPEFEPCPDSAGSTKSAAHSEDDDIDVS